MKNIIDSVWVIYFVKKVIQLIQKIERQTDTRLFNPESLNVSREHLEEILKKTK